MDTPTYNAEGMQIYKPQPGEYWKHGLKFRESYGGIIAEIQDTIQRKGGGVHTTYPQNFAGIIAALNDLGKLISGGNLPDVGELPPGWEIIIKPDGSIDGGWQEDPQDGMLWFDTRQGRLFIAIDGEYWQTNGADGLTQVSDTVPTKPPVIGSTWFDTVHEVLYVYVGTDDDDNGLWQVVKGAGELTQTTATLPLTMARSTFEIYTPTYLPVPSPTLMRVQKDFNEYTFASLVALDRALTESTVLISSTPPTENVLHGSLWYDSESLELSIWYEDDDAGQWVPTSVSYSYDDDLAIIRSSVVAETTAREYAIGQLLLQIEGLRQGGIPDVDALETKVDALEKYVIDNLAGIDLTGYVSEEELYVEFIDLTNQINTVNARIPDFTGFASKSVLDELQETVNLLPTTSYVTDAIFAAQPDLSSFVTQANINTSIDNITTEFLPRKGGTLSGAFIVNKVDMAAPAFDFSNEKWYSYNTHKYRTNSIESNFATFGTNENPWEYAWDFSSNEDFCWVYSDSNKVFSITKDGPACSQLYLADFGSNDANNGRVLHNTINVRDRLTTYQSTFESLRQGVSNATDFNSLKTNILIALANV